MRPSVDMMVYIVMKSTPAGLMAKSYILKAKKLADSALQFKIIGGKSA